MKRSACFRLVAPCFQMRPGLVLFDRPAMPLGPRTPLLERVLVRLRHTHEKKKKKKKRGRSVRRRQEGGDCRAVGAEAFARAGVRAARGRARVGGRRGAACSPPACRIALSLGSIDAVTAEEQGASGLEVASGGTARLSAPRSRAQRAPAVLPLSPATGKALHESMRTDQTSCVRVPGLLWLLVTKLAL